MWLLAHLLGTGVFRTRKGKNAYEITVPAGVNLRQEDRISSARLLQAQYLRCHPR